MVPETPFSIYLNVMKFQVRLHSDQLHGKLLANFHFMRFVSLDKHFVAGVVIVDIRHIFQVSSNRNMW